LPLGNPRETRPEVVSTARYLLPSPTEKLEIGKSDREIRRAVVAELTDEELALLTKVGERIEEQQRQLGAISERLGS
jgi:hypothetical protein